MAEPRLSPTDAKPKQMYPSTDELVMSYFTFNFFSPDPTTVKLPGTTDCNVVLDQAILSLGTLSIANNHGSARDVVRARHRYGIALRSANRCLLDPAQALHDDTLSAILVLGVFEVSYTSHAFPVLDWTDIQSAWTAGRKTQSINGPTTYEGHSRLFDFVSV